MSFIDQKTREYNQKHRDYTISEIEELVADNIVERIKREIELAIENGQSSVSTKYDYDDGILWATKMNETVGDYIESDSGFQLPYLIAYTWEKDQAKQGLRDAVLANDKILNLSRIKTIVHSKVVDLGAKNVAITLMYCKEFSAKIPRRGILRDYYEFETRPLNKFKLCYVVSW